MTDLHVAYAGHLSDRVYDLYSRATRPTGLEFDFTPLPPVEAFRRMLEGEFEVGELSLSTYIIHRSRGDERFIAIPAFPSRVFRHRAIYVNTRAGIQAPGDLRGRKVGVPEYQMTAAVWARGALQHEYGLDPKEMIWVTGGLKEAGRRPLVAVDVPGVSVEPVHDRSLNDLLLAGEIDAIIAPHAPPAFDAGDPRVARLFPDYRQVERAYFERTRIFPIMHTVVLKRSFYDEVPWAAASLFDAFHEAKQNCLQRLRAVEPLPISLPWIDVEVEATRTLFGDDFWPYGVEENRLVLETACRYVEEQGLGRSLDVDDLFVTERAESKRSTVP
ncbi:MAG: ABC transporter substrate-binding protein [Actinobacteria bacterium]|nr:ABC transporter substrate-binding protein [Actinomycetota bacterium]